MMKHNRYIISALLIFLLGLSANAQTTAFTYQGSLANGGTPANGNYDFEILLFDAPTGGAQIGTAQARNNVAVANGIFKVDLDFGNQFPGANRYLEIRVRIAGGGGYTPLAPRHLLTSTPYAVKAATADTATTATNATQFGGLPAARYVATDTIGRVGIGTAAPSTKLEIVDPIRQLRFGPTTADNGGYLISTVPSQAIISGGAKFDGTNWIAGDTAASLTQHVFGKIEFFTNNNLTAGSPFGPIGRMVIEANGNVGIGTPAAAPGYKVDINTNGGGIRGFFNGSTHFVSETSGGTNAWAKFIMKTPNRQWAMGTSQNFNGDQLYIADETAGQIRLFIDTTGVVSVPVLNIRGGADFSENFDISEANGSGPGAVAKDVLPGLVVSIDQKNPGKLVISRRAYDRSVAGVVSGAGGVNPGLVMGQKDSIADGKYPVALSGRTWVYADATRSAIKPGDLLSTSATPGHAMKVTNYRKAHGAIIGKAMTGLKSGCGLVLVLVSLQ